LTEKPIKQNNQTTRPEPSHPPSKAASIEHYKAALMRVEEENYKLLQENAELKRKVRECSCGGARK
jgi:hypothetical protein